MNQWPLGPLGIQLVWGGGFISNFLKIIGDIHEQMFIVIVSLKRQGDSRCSRLRGRLLDSE
jgi:hypothetical protein